MATVYSARNLKWKGNGLYLGKRCLSRIDPDDDWPGMWRVVEANGSLSDMVNLSRAKDAAMNRALGILNVKRAAS